VVCDIVAVYQYMVSAVARMLALARDRRKLSQGVVVVVVRPRSNSRILSGMVQ
jgi:hypothetical protein